MTATALPLPLAVPLLVSAVLIMVRRPVWLRRVLTLGSLGAVLAYGAVLVRATYGGTVLVENIGLWPGGIAIPFVADMLSALLLVVTAFLTMVCVVFGMVAGEDDRHYFAPLTLVLFAGVAGALLTGDLFNLFVCVEVMLLPSYVLISMFGGKDRLRAGRVYITYSLLASAVFLAGVAFVYGVVGAVNFAALAGAAKESTAVAVAMGVVLVALAMKAAVVPTHGWLPRTYPETSPAISALFSGLHTKVSIYAIYRIYALVYDGEERYLGVATLIVCVTMVVGAVGSLGERRMRSVLVFNMVSGIGYILVGVALFGPLGLAAGLFYMLHHMVVKVSLLLSTGTVEHAYGTQRIDELGGLARREPLVAFVFVGAALSLAGIPPFSGFAGKFLLLQAAVAESAYVTAFVVVAASLVTLAAMVMIFNGVFWGRSQWAPSGTSEPPGSKGAGSPSGNAGRPEPAGETESGNGVVHRIGSVVETTRRHRIHAKASPPLTRVRLSMLAPALLLTLLSLAMGVGAEGVLALTQDAAAGLTDTSTYVEAVLGR